MVNMDKCEIERQAAKISNLFGVSEAEVIQVITVLSQAADKVTEAVITVWDAIKENIGLWLEEYTSQNEPVHPAYKTKTFSYVMKSQVLDNKLLRVCVRTNC